ncbi:MAG TPA: glutamate--tRNA ligase [Clostridia bacterium]|nr:glutamate--tRNA ligase [Clostridia bacterium]
MTENKSLADLLLPDVNLTPSDVFARYPQRGLNELAMVTRFAPSPTGMLHVGGLYAALVFERLAHQSGGVCFLRIEDTDKKRELKDSIFDIISSLNYFGVNFDEGPTISGDETGNYGPYKQSDRSDIYKVFVKDLIERGLAYPCFCSSEELAGIRNSQKEHGVTTGYYGEWAKHRSLTYEQVKIEIDNGKPYVIRLKSPGSAKNRIKFTDLIKGYIEMPENNQDIIILKSDGLPTYHFAHAVDDRLMGTTHVLRADEWLSSVPVHLQLLDVLGFDKLYYGHISPVMKLDGASKRKFSKRKDLDGIAEYYRKRGYPGLAVIEYFMSLVNSDFEEWRTKNPIEPYTNFHIRIEKMSVSGALLDMNKLNDVSKDTISRLDAVQAYDQLCGWAAKYDAELSFLLETQKDYVLRILSIGRSGTKPRKDITTWSDFKPAFSYFFDELFSATSIKSDLPMQISIADAKTIVTEYLSVFDYFEDKETWFNKMKEMAGKLGFAEDMKSYRKNPENYRGNVGDIAMVIRIALTGKANTPDLYEIIQVMGMERTICRLKEFIEP